MKKLMLGLVAVGALIALRPVVKRRMVQKMREHCTQMAGHCREMMGAQHEATGREAVSQKMCEHCEPLTAEHDDRRDTVVMTRNVEILDAAPGHW
jgi:hypothetical protein